MKLKNRQMMSSSKVSNDGFNLNILEGSAGTPSKNGNGKSTSTILTPGSNTPSSKTSSLKSSLKDPPKYTGTVMIKTEKMDDQKLADRKKKSKKSKKSKKTESSMKLMKDSKPPKEVVALREGSDDDVNHKLEFDESSDISEPHLLVASKQWSSCLI